MYLCSNFTARVTCCCGQRLSFFWGGALSYYIWTGLFSGVTVEHLRASWNKSKVKFCWTSLVCLQGAFLVELLAET